MINLLHAPIKNIDKFISLVNPYAIKVDANKINKSEK